MDPEFGHLFADSQGLGADSVFGDVSGAVTIQTRDLPLFLSSS